MQFNKNTVVGIVLTSLSVVLTMPSAAAQTRAEQAAERRAMAEQRLEMLAANRAERVGRRAEVFTRMSEVTPEMIQDRLDEAEAVILEELAEADAELIAATISRAGFNAGAALTTREFYYVDDEQIDTLVAAAGRAATITPEDIAQLLEMTSIQASEAFDSIDVEEIASSLNEIGEKALSVEAVR